MKRTYFYLFLLAFFVVDAASAQTRGRRGDSNESTPPSETVRRSEPVRIEPPTRSEDRGRGTRSEDRGNDNSGRNNRSGETRSTPQPTPTPTPQPPTRVNDRPQGNNGNNGSNGGYNRGDNGGYNRGDNSRTNTPPTPQTPPVDPNRGRNGNGQNGGGTSYPNGGNTSRPNPNGNDRNNDRNTNDRNRGNDNDRFGRNNNDDRNGNDRYGNNRNGNDRNGNDRYDNNRNGNDRSRYERYSRYGNSSYNSRRRYTPSRTDYYHNDYRWFNWSRPIWADQSRYSWASSYVFKQYVAVDNGWNYNGSELEIRTRVRQNTRRTNSSYAQAEFTITGIELYQDGYFLGRVNYIPSYLSRVTASLSPSGNINFDNMLYLIGDPERGFEVINSRFYNSYLMSRLFGERSARVGYLDLDNGRVLETSYSHFLDDRSYSNNTMIPLVPENEDWGFGYTVAGFDYNDNWYSRNGGYNDNNGYYRNGNDTYNRQNVAPGSSQMYRNGNQESFRTESGGNVQLRRRVEIEKDR